MVPPMLGGYVLPPDHNSRHCGAISVVKIFSGIRQGGALEAVREMNGRWHAVVGDTRYRQSGKPDAASQLSPIFRTSFSLRRLNRK